MTSHEEENKEALESLSSGFQGDQMWKKVLLGLVAGLVVGVLLGPDLDLIPRHIATTLGEWMALPGNLFLTLVRFIVIPLVLASITVGIAGGNDAAAVRKIGGTVVLYFLMTTTFSVSVAIFLTKYINPGSYVDQSIVSQAVDKVGEFGNAAMITSSSIPQTIIAILPTNPMASMAQGQMLQIVIASIIFGLALLMIPKKESDPLVDLLTSVQSASMAIVSWVMKIVPLAVFGLLANAAITFGISAITGISVYVLTFLGVLLALLAFYSVILVTVSKRSPLTFFRQIREPFIIAFSTSSSSATMPVTLRTATEKVGVNPTVASMVVPLGATVNMDGTAAYQAVVVVFLAQVFGIDLSFAQLATLLAITIGASIGTPGMPGGAIAILAAILLDFGIPIEGIALILAVDRILDMCRTAVNVTGDIVTTTVVERFSGLRLKKSE